MTVRRTWEVLLLGGASGVGKTSVSYRLARHFGVGITEVDDFQVVLQHYTTPEQQPALHLFPRTPEAFFVLDDDAKLAHAIALATELSPAVECAVANHLESRAPVVLEGDFILPMVAAQQSFGGVAAAGRVAGLFLIEDDEEQLRRNFFIREGEDQPTRARLSQRYGGWLRAEAERYGIACVPARPWGTVLERCIAALA